MNLLLSLKHLTSISYHLFHGLLVVDVRHYSLDTYQFYEILK